jgi:hypothetical protein
MFSFTLQKFLVKFTPRHPLYSTIGFCVILGAGQAAVKVYDSFRLQLLISAVI